MMTKAGYADFATHKKIHVGFLADLEGLETPIPQQKIGWAKQWYVSFIYLEGNQTAFQSNEQLEIEAFCSTVYSFA